jgi:RNA recognition motif-containing protein
VADKYKPIILNDQAVFEEAEGDFLKVIELRQELVRLERLVEQQIPQKGNRKREIEVEHYDVDKGAKKSPQVKHQTRFIFMRDIPFNITEERLGEFLETECGAGKPVQVLIVRDDTGKSRGFGYAEFESFEQANIAISKSGTKLKNRSVVIVPSDREITVKRERPTQNQHEAADIQPSLPTEREEKKDNEYFRNLISSKQKRIS